MSKDILSEKTKQLRKEAENLHYRIATLALYQNAKAKRLLEKSSARYQRRKEMEKLRRLIKFAPIEITDEKNMDTVA